MLSLIECCEVLRIPTNPLSVDLSAAYIDKRLTEALTNLDKSMQKVKLLLDAYQTDENDSSSEEQSGDDGAYPVRKREIEAAAITLKDCGEKLRIKILKERKSNLEQEYELERKTNKLDLIDAALKDIESCVRRQERDLELINNMMTIFRDQIYTDPKLNEAFNKYEIDEHIQLDDQDPFFIQLSTAINRRDKLVVEWFKALINSRQVLSYGGREITVNISFPVVLVQPDFGAIFRGLFDLSPHKNVLNKIKEPDNFLELFPAFLSLTKQRATMSELGIQLVREKEDLMRGENGFTVRFEKPIQNLEKQIIIENRRLEKLEAEQKTEQNTLKVNAFLKIYYALREGQTGLFKGNFWKDKYLKSRNPQEAILLIEEHAEEVPTSRTAEAWKLAQLHFNNCNPDNQKLVKAIYQDSFVKSSFFSQSKFAGKTFFHCEAKKLFKSKAWKETEGLFCSTREHKGIALIESDTRTGKIMRALSDDKDNAEQEKQDYHLSKRTPR